MSSSALPRLRRRRCVNPLPGEPSLADLQAVQRDRRRQHLPIHYVGAFSLHGEIAAILDPLAARVTYEPRPEQFRAPVLDLGDAVHAAVTSISRMLSERDALRRCAHLSVDERGRAVKMLLDLADRPPAPPEPSPAALVDGSWTGPLIELAEPYSGGLSGMLDHATPEDHLRGQLSVSDRVIVELRLIDTAAQALTNRLDYAEHYRRQFPAPRTESALDNARAELQRLGVRVE